MQTPPTIEPSSITAGDTITWSRSLSDYPASSGWVLNYSLLSLVGSIQITTTADSDGHLVKVLPVDSTQYVPGTYNWQAWVTDGTDRVQVSRGTIEVLPDYAASGTAAMDTRSHAKRLLDAIEATLEGTATTDQQELTIDGTTIKRKSVTDLLKLRQLYLSEYKSELQAAKIAAGLGSGNRILVRFK